MPRANDHVDMTPEMLDSFEFDAPYMPDEWVPNVGEDGISRQALFLMDWRHQYQMVMGGAGSGKTTAAIRKCITLTQEEPGIVGLITRTTGPALRATTFPDFVQICPPGLIKDGGITMFPNPVVRFKNGSIIHFVAYDGKDAEKIRSMNLGFIWMEEATLFKENTWQEFTRRLRQTQGVAYDEDGKPYKSLIGRRFIFLTTNPNGRDWVWKIFIRDKDLYKDAQGEPTSAYWIMPSTDNKENLPPDFFDSAKRLPKELYERFILGQVNELSGCVYPTFNREDHVTNVEGWVPSPWWPVFVGMDYGYKTPCTAVWMTFDERGNCIVFREYGLRMGTPRRNAFAIKGITEQLRLKGMQEPSMYVIDPSTKQHKGESEEGKTTFDLLTAEGLPLVPGSRDLAGRILKLAMRLERDPGNKIHPITGEKSDLGWPSITFTRDCPELIKELESWQWKEIKEGGDEKERPQERDDHYHDGLSYALAESGMEAGPDPEIEFARRNTDQYRVEQFLKNRAKKPSRGMGVY